MNPPPLPYGKSWRVKSKAQVRIRRSQICRSLTLLKSPPSAPAHSARPPKSMLGAGFCDFHFARHWPSEMQKTYPPRSLVRFCIKNVSCKTHFAGIFALHHLFPIFCKNVLPAFGGKHNSEKRLRIPSIKNLTFLTPKRLQNDQLL